MVANKVKTQLASVQQTKTSSNAQNVAKASKLMSKQKENDQLAANTNSSVKSTLAGSTIEKKNIYSDDIGSINITTTGAKQPNTIVNQRYEQSSVVKQYENEENEEQPLRQTAPFYIMKNSNDEDVEGFQKKLDMMIVQFRSETMSEFIKTKKQVLTDQSQTIDAERRRCNTLLGVKQNEIEQLKENLGSKTKLCDDLNTRCEAMAFWSGKSKMLLRIKLLQHRAFQGLKQYRDFKKHSKLVLEHKMRQYRESVKRQVFIAWEKQYKTWKIVKNREDFDKAVKLELQNISAQYNKEIESLRSRLDEAQHFVDSEQRHKTMMQENLKKAFMRGVCALNFEAMNILNPNDVNYQQQIESEMEKQVSYAMNTAAQASTFSPQKVTNNVANHEYQQSYRETDSDYSNDRNMMTANVQLNNPFVSTMSHDQSADHYKKIESKDSMWKPAPIMGREMQQPTFTYQQPSITSQLKTPQQLQSNIMLSSHFSRPQTASDNVVITSRMNDQQQHISRIEEDTDKRVLPGNPTVISSLPDLMSQQQQNNSVGEGRMIYANKPTPAKTVGTAAKKQSSIASKKPTTTK